MITSISSPSVDGKKIYSTVSFVRFAAVNIILLFACSLNAGVSDSSVLRQREPQTSNVARGQFQEMSTTALSPSAISLPIVMPILLGELPPQESRNIKSIYNQALPYGYIDCSLVYKIRADSPSNLDSEVLLLSRIAVARPLMDSLLWQNPHPTRTLASATVSRWQRHSLAAGVMRSLPQGVVDDVELKDVLLLSNSDVNRPAELSSIIRRAFVSAIPGNHLWIHRIDARRWICSVLVNIADAREEPKGIVYAFVIDETFGTIKLFGSISLPPSDSLKCFFVKDLSVFKDQGKLLLVANIWAAYQKDGPRVEPSFALSTWEEGNYLFAIDWAGNTP